MKNLRIHKPFSKGEFESVLDSMSPNKEFPKRWYTIHWEETDGNFSRIDSPNEFGEYCYIIPIELRPTVLIKVFSSIQRDDSYSRDIGEDAIRIVLADNTGKPIHRAFKRINRTGNWKYNLRKRVSEALTRIGFDTNCPRCGSILFLKKISTGKRRFLGCSKHPRCEGSRNSIRLNKNLSTKFPPSPQG